MKKTLAVFLLLISSACYAQDVITLSDGRNIQAKIIEITADVVKYKRFDNQDGPLFSVALNTITKVKYANGSEEFFSTNSSGDDGGQAKGSGGDANLPPIFKGTFDVNDSATERYIEAIALNAGSKVLERCTGHSDNSATEIFYGEVFRDDIALEIHVPIKIKWDKGLANKERSIRGVIIIDRYGKKRWQYQGDSGITFSGCAKGPMEF